MASQALKDVDEGWWAILKHAVAESAESRPFATLVALLATFVIVTVAPIWLRLHYRHLKERARQRAELEKVRANPRAGGRHGR